MMMLPSITLDLDEMRQNLLRQKEPRRVHFFEHGVSDEMRDELVNRFALMESSEVERSAPAFAWEKEIQVQRFLGCEVFRVWLPGAEFAVAGSRGTTWGEEHTGQIQSWADLENYD